MTHRVARIWVDEHRLASLLGSKGSLAVINGLEAPKCARTCEARSAKCEINSHWKIPNK